MSFAAKSGSTRLWLQLTLVLFSVQIISMFIYNILRRLIFYIVNYFLLFLFEYLVCSSNRCRQYLDRPERLSDNRWTNINL